VAPRLVLRLQTRQERSAGSTQNRAIGRLPTLPAGENASRTGIFVRSSSSLRYRAPALGGEQLSDHFFRTSSAAMRHVWEPQACMPLHPPWATKVQCSTCVACIYPGQPVCGVGPRFAGWHNGMHGAELSLPASGPSAYHASCSEARKLSALSFESKSVLAGTCRLESGTLGH
jgi:hypothetical protein